MPVHTTILDPTLRAELVLMKSKHGVQNAARLLCTSRVTLERASLGGPIQRGTAALLKQRLSEIKITTQTTEVR
jgi:hypothetical protein